MRICGHGKQHLLFFARRHAADIFKLEQKSSKTQTKKSTSPHVHVLYKSQDRQRKLPAAHSCERESSFINNVEFFVAGVYFRIHPDGVCSRMYLIKN